MLKKIFMKQLTKLLFTSLFIKASFLCTCLLTYAQAENTGTENISPPKVNAIEQFLDSIKIDLPPSEVTCRATGSLSQLFSKTSKFKSRGNTFFIDTKTREIANFQRAVIEKPDKKITLQILIKVKDIKRRDLLDLLFKKKIIGTSSAQIIFVIKTLTKEGESVFINESKDKDGNPINSTLFAQVSKLSNITYNGEKFLTGDGILKIHFPNPPKKIDSDGNLADAFENAPASLICTCKQCPFHDFDLTDLKDAFDGQLADAVISEASMTGN